MSRLLYLENLHNTRDLGGMETTDGRRIRSGKLIRSGHLYGSSTGDLSALGHLIDTVVDFRTPQEKEEKPDPAVSGVKFWHIPIFDSLKAGVTREEESDAQVIRMMMGDHRRAKAYMCGIYTDFVSVPFEVSQYEKFVRLLLEPHEKAVLWHCTAGKDRAGFASVIVEELLGVDRAAIRADYLQSNECLAEDIRELIGMFYAMEGEENPEAELALRYLFGAREEFRDAVYAEIEKRYGGFDGFISDGLHISPDEREALKQMYLV